MVYLNNNTELQEVWIPKNDGTGSSHKPTKDLEGVDVTISQDITVVHPSSGYYGMSAVTIDATEYGQQNYDNGFDDGYTDGYASGSTEGYESGYTSGYTSGSTDGYNSGVTDGEQSIIDTFTSTTITENGQYGSSANPYSAVTVNVPQTGHTDQELQDAYDSGYTSGSTDGFNSGYTSGETHQKSLLVSTAITQNGSYQRENGYSAITVNVPTGQTYNIEENKPFVVNTNGNYTIKPSSGITTINDHFDSDVDRYYITATTSGYPLTGKYYLFYIEDEFDSSKGQIDVYIENGYLDYNDIGWDGGEIVDWDTGDRLVLEIRNANRDFGWYPLEDFSYHYDVMSAVSLTVQPIKYVEYIETDGSQIIFDTGVKVGSDDSSFEVDIDFMPLSKSNVNTFLSDEDDRFNILFRVWGDEYQTAFGNLANNADILVNNRYDVTFNYASYKGNVKCNGADVIPMQNARLNRNSLVHSLYLNYGIAGNCPSARYYKLKITKNGVEHLFRPCLDLNNVPCFYDEYNGVYLYKTGRGTPTAGPLLPSEEYQSGYTDGQNSIISTFTAMTATTNGVYGSSANPLSSITVNVPQTGSTAVLGVKTITANGTYSASTDSLDGYSAVTVNISAAKKLYVTVNDVKQNVQYYSEEATVWNVVNENYTTDTPLEIFYVHYYEYKFHIYLLPSGKYGYWDEEENSQQPQTITTINGSATTQDSRSTYTMEEDGNGLIVTSNNGSFYEVLVSEEILSELSAITITSNTAITVNNGGYSAITVNVPQTGSSADLIPYIERTLTNLVIPSGCTTVGWWGCAGFRNITALTISDTVTSLNIGAFADCESLTEVTIPNSVTLIQDSVFSSCESLSSVTLSNAITIIPKKAFSGCESLENVTMYGGITQIKESAFEDCYSLQTITIPSSVTFIEYAAFHNCSALTEINCYATIAPSLENYVFFGCPSTGTVHYPAGSDYSSWQSNQYLSGWTFVGDL